MRREPAERVLHGLAAAGGVAVGPAWRVHPVAMVDRVPGTPVEERAALAGAIRAAAAEVTALAGAETGAAADILAFQVALLEDEALAEDAFSAIAAGVPAERAWREALDNEIAGYLAAADEHFRARSADLADIRDRVLRHLLRLAETRPPPGAVLVAEDIQPSQFLAMDWSRGGGMVLGAGSPMGHVAMLARARGVPMVVGVGPDGAELSGLLLVDGDTGEVTLAPAETTLMRAGRQAAVERARAASAQSRWLEPARTRDGTLIQVLVNVAGLADLADLPVEACDGIGLARTEFLAQGALDDEEAQVALYRELVGWARGRPVTIRTLDAGGDKPIPGYTFDGETNPFLGLRGIRLSLRHPERLGVQLRALARAAAAGPVRVMLPMVTRQDEIDAAADLLDRAVAGLRADGIEHARPALGIMVEVPALALSIEGIRADFLSIGSNDLVQYATAAARDHAAVADYADPLHPGVLALIAHVAGHGTAGGRPVGLCGDAAADPRVIPALLAAGLRSLSVAPGLIARTKAVIREVDLSSAGRP